MALFRRLQSLLGELVGVALAIGRKDSRPSYGAAGGLLVRLFWWAAHGAAEEWREADQRRLAAWVRETRRLERRNRGEPMSSESTPMEWELRAAYHDRRAATLRMELDRLRVSVARRVPLRQSRKRRRSTRGH